MKFSNPSAALKIMEELEHELKLQAIMQEAMRINSLPAGWPPPAPPVEFWSSWTPSITDWRPVT